LLTCHNRRDRTIRCLRGLFAQRADGVVLSAVLVDDGCTDGTGEAVRAEFPRLRVLRGDGKLFWCGGMRRAFAEAMRDGPDYYLWLNDDVALAPHALASLFETAKGLPRKDGAYSIVVGSTRDPHTGAHSYGGVVRAGRWHPLVYAAAPPANEPVRCHTMNGNCVLIPRVVAERIGNLDPAFTHGMGDFDYGLRAAEGGCSLWVAPGYVGTCARNSVAGTWQDASLPLAERWRGIRGPRGLPPREWAVYCRRHGGPLWPLFWATPYLGVLMGRDRSAKHCVPGARHAT
jgi:GT2 family glycosyltransferase